MKLINDFTPIFEKTVSAESRNAFCKHFLANNNASIPKTFASVEFINYGENGIPLKYSRDEFISDVNKFIAKESYTNKKNILSKLGMQPQFDDNDELLIAYDGFPSIENLKKKTNSALIKIVNKFTKENEVVTDNQNLNKIINGVIKGIPEWVSVIGKKQHEVSYGFLPGQPVKDNVTADIHILRVLQDAMKNPEYEKLSDKSKTILKFSILLHDIAKKENTLDKEHQYKGAICAKEILKRLNLSSDMKDRIFEMVQNHHWLEEFNKKGVAPEVIATKFRRKEDYQIAKIFAEADLKSIGYDNSYYKQFGKVLEDDAQKPIKEFLEKIYSTGNFLFTSRIVTPSRIPQIEHGGKTYKVLDLTKLEESCDMEQFGFVRGTKKKDLRFLTHFVAGFDLYNNLKRPLIKDMTQEGLSFSLISSKEKTSFDHRRYGLIADADNIDVALMSKENIGTGGNKDFNKLVYYLTRKNSIGTSPREFFIDHLQWHLKDKNVNYLDAAYSDIYPKLAQSKFLSQIKDVDVNRIYNVDISPKKIKGSNLQKAMKSIQNILFKKNEYNEQNEILAYNPKFKALVCKVPSINRVEPEVLQIAQEEKLPIILIGY